MTTDRPKRLIARAMTDFLVTSAQAWARPHDGDLTQAFVFCTVLHANLEQLSSTHPLTMLAAGGEDDGAVPRRPISVHAVASSLSLPYETVRRKILAMEAAGAIERLPAGVVVCSAALRSAGARTAMTEVRGQLEEALRILATLGLDLATYGEVGTAAPHAAIQRPSDALVALIVTGAQVRMLERIAAILGDVITAYLFGGILRANQTDILRNSQTAWLYAGLETPAPDAIRKPVTVVALSRQLGLPLETVRRHVKRGVYKKYLVATDQGIFAPTGSIEVEADQYQISKMSLEFFRMLGELAQVGFFLSPDP